MVILNISSCKKYKYEVENVYGIYNIHKYYVDDFDSTFYFEQFNTSYVAFAPNSNIMDFVNRNIDTNSHFYINIRAYWKFINKNEGLNIEIKRPEGGYESWIQQGPLSLDTNYNWDIINLDANEFVFQTSYENRIYKLILYRQ
jgi:hypothetical protein